MRLQNYTRHPKRYPESLPIRNIPTALLVGSDNKEDAAVYQISMQWVHSPYLLSHFWGLEPGTKGFGQNLINIGSKLKDKTSAGREVLI